MRIPGVSLCMECHKSVKTDSPHIKKLARFAEVVAGDEYCDGWVYGLSSGEKG